MVGFCWLDKVWLPKSQFQNFTLPVDWSIKLTESGPQPEVLLEVKAATGFCPASRVQINKHDTA
jgi:hypothetical protein